jgi:dipeptidyl aminopeptidase/acylaminoacyl peptidase
MRFRWIGVSVALAAFAGAGPVSAQQIPDSLAVENVPPAPRELTDGLNRYQNIRLAVLEDWSPDGREVLILTRFAETNQVHRVAGPLGAREQLTFLKERVGGARTRPGRRQFLYSSDEGGAENFQFFLFDLATGQASRLTDGRSRNVSPRWSPDGRRLAWSSNARNGKDMDLWVTDPSDPASARRVKEVSGDWIVSDWSPDGRTLAAVESISANESYLHLVDAATGATQDLTPRPLSGREKAFYGQVRWSRDGTSLYWTTDAGSEFHRLEQYGLKTRTPRVLTGSIPWDVEDFELSDDGRLIAFVTNEEGLSRLRLLDTTTDRELPAPELPPAEISRLAFRPGSQEIGFTLTSARIPSDVYSYDTAGKVLTRWTKSETGGLDPASFPEPELVAYKSFDGRSIPAFVYKPPGKAGTAPFPVIVNIHGGPEGQSRPGFLGRTAYFVAELGIVMIYPNVRGSTGYGKTYLKLDNGMRREDAVRDIGALLDWIKTRPELDASRVGVMGGSYGGYMTLATMTHYGERIRCGMDTVGISNFLTFLKNTQDYRRDLRRAEYGDERDPKMSEFLEKISPLSSARKIVRPLLVAAGKNDPRVPVTESEQIVAAVRANGVPVWYVLGKNEGHGFQKKNNQDYLQAAQALFVARFLLPEKPGS